MLVERVLGLLVLEDLVEPIPTRLRKDMLGEGFEKGSVLWNQKC